MLQNRTAMSETDVQQRGAILTFRCDVSGARKEGRRGVLPMPARVFADLRSYWMPFFQVVDFDASTAKAKEQGAMLAMFKFAGV